MGIKRILKAYKMKFTLNLRKNASQKHFCLRFIIYFANQIHIKNIFLSNNLNIFQSSKIALYCKHPSYKSPNQT